MIQESNAQVLLGNDADLGSLRDDIQRNASLSLPKEEEVLYQTQGKIQREGEDDRQKHDGTVLVTSKRLLFVASQDKARDVAIDAECIHLHAMSSEPLLSVYVQITEPGPGDDFIELSIIPDNAENKCQGVFDALSRLVAMHPITDSDNDDDGDNNMMFMAPPMTTAAENGLPTPDERQAMLDRLDNLLVVPPEYEVDDGQFDDAEENVADEDEDDDDPLL